MFNLIVFFAIIILLIYFFVGDIQPVIAALPPLSQEILCEDSAYIIVANVQKVTAEEKEKKKDFTDIYFTATVKVENVEKAEISNDNAHRFSNMILPETIPEQGMALNVYYWQVGKRPMAWNGPSGQYSSLQPNTKVRLYLQVNLKGKLILLEPNGFEQIDEDS